METCNDNRVILKNNISDRYTRGFGYKILTSLYNDNPIMIGYSEGKLNSITNNKIMKDFVIINQTRIRKSIIKCYLPVNETYLKVVYTPSRTQPNNEVFQFPTQEDRDNMVSFLDNVL